MRGSVEAASGAVLPGDGRMLAAARSWSASQATRPCLLHVPARCACPAAILMEKTLLDGKVMAAYTQTSSHSTALGQPHWALRPAWQKAALRQGIRSLGGAP